MAAEATYQEQEAYRQQVIVRARRCDIRFDTAWVQEDGTIELTNLDGVTFDGLAALSKEFGTTRIDVACDTGCASDPCHDTSLFIRGADHGR